MPSLLNVLLSTLLPEEIYLNFDLVSVQEHRNRIELRLEEHAELVPPALSRNEKIVLDDFCSPIELLNFSLRNNPTYLKFYRRRWKQSGTDKHYSNSYDLHPEGVRATHSFASFLKEEAGLTPNEYLHSFFGSSDE